MSPCTKDIGPSPHRLHEPRSTPKIWKILGYFILLLVIIGCCFLYALGTFEKFLSIFYVTGYGTLSISYYFCTTLFAYINRKRSDKLALKVMDDIEVYNLPSVSIHITGYREDPNYFEDCLESVKELVYANVKGIVVSIDGNDTEDLYMVDIAKRVFGDIVHVNLDFIPSQVDQNSFR